MSVEKSPSVQAPRNTTIVDRLNLMIYLRRYLKLIGRRWILLLIGAVIGCSVAAYRAYSKVDMYLSTSTLSIMPKVQTDTRIEEAKLLEATSNYMEGQLTLMNSQTLRARAFDAVLNEDASLGAWVAENGGKAGAIQANAAPSGDASFSMQVRSPKPLLAQRFADAWAKEFLEFKEDKARESFNKEAVKITDDIRATEQNLESVRREISDFQQKHQIANVNEYITLRSKEFEKNIAEREALETEISLLDETTSEQIANGEFQGPSTLPSGSQEKGSAVSPDNKSELSALDNLNNGERFRLFYRETLDYQQQLKSMENILKEPHPHIAFLKSRITNLQREMNTELTLIQQSRDATLSALKKRLERLNELIAQKQTELAEKSKIAEGYKALTQKSEDLRLRLKELNSALDQVDRGDSNIKLYIVEAGTPPFSVWGKPERQKMILMGLLTGLAVGLGIAYFLHQLDDRLELAADVEDALEEPVLGQVPEVDKEELEEDYILLTNLKKNNMFAESIRGVRSAVMLGVEGGPKQFLLVSSAVPGDGKTTFTVNFAATLAIAGHRVLLVDADMRRGNIHLYFKQDRKEGLSDILQGQLHWLDVLKETNIPSLNIITTGNLPNNPGELLVSPVTQQFMAEIKQDYDYVIFDCPPLTALDDTYSLSSAADGLIFVVRSGQTSMRFAKTALESVRQRGARILGIVLNGVTADNPYYYYNNYYHSYYSKQEEGADEPINPNLRQATQMAAPKKRRRHGGMSIEAQAKKYAGTSSSSSKSASGLERSKAEEFKARRRLREQQLQSENLHQSDEAASSRPIGPDDVREV